MQHKGLLSSKIEINLKPKTGSLYVKYYRCNQLSSCPPYSGTSEYFFVVDIFIIIIIIIQAYKQISTPDKKYIK